MRLKALILCGAVTSLALCRVEGGAIPAAALDESVTTLASRMKDAQFKPLLDVHRTQYAMDREWSADWAEARYSQSGILAEYGSITGNELYYHEEIMLNFPLTGRLRARYDRRAWEDGRFDQYYERMDLQALVGDQMAVVLSGMPAYAKKEASFGGGLLLGQPGGTNYFQALVVWDSLVYNGKTSEPRQFTQQPVRYLMDGYWHSREWRVYGALNWVAAYEMDAGAESVDSGPLQHRRAWTRSGSLCVDRFWGRIVTGLRADFASEGLDRDAGGGLGEADDAVTLSRKWGRGEGFVRHTGPVWVTEGFFGHTRQRDRFDAAALAGGRYDMNAMLFGMGAGRRVSASSDVYAGYIGSVANGDRTNRDRIPASEESADWGGRRTKNLYTDKIHVRWLYHFGSRLKTECLLSHELSSGNFGGGSFKGIFLF